MPLMLGPNTRISST